MTKIIAHRGDTSRYPENTVEAFEAAQQAGADGIELDVHETSDGILVVHHDYYLGNPDNGLGTIPFLPYSSIKNLTINNKYFIPKLVDVFDKFGKKFHYEIELKCLTIGAAKEVVSLAEKHDLLTSIEFTSPHPYILPSLKSQCPAIKTGYFAPLRPDWMEAKLYTEMVISQAKLGVYNVVHLRPEDITSSNLPIFHAAGLLVHAADCDDAATLSRIKNLGVDQLSTNNLSAALA